LKKQFFYSILISDFEEKIFFERIFRIFIMAMSIGNDQRDKDFAYLEDKGLPTPDGVPTYEGISFKSFYSLSLSLIFSSLSFDAVRSFYVLLHRKIRFLGDLKLKILFFLKSV
jgi:hypothetical protein